MKKRIALFLAAVLLLGLTACGAKSTVSMERSMDYGIAEDSVAMYQESAAEPMQAAGVNGASGGTELKSAVGTDLPQNRKWVITMNMEAETDDLDKTLAALNAQIIAAGGYIEGQSINNASSYRRSRNASLTIRIPAESVDAFAAEVSGLANVVSNSRNVRDITLRYSDIESMVTALKTEQTRLLELLEQAENMSDLLEIEARLTEVRYQLESHASTLRLYDNQVDYATLSLYISEVQKYTPVEEPGFWSRITTGLSESIVDLGQTAVDAAVWFIVNLPYLVLLGLAAWAGAALGKAVVRRRKAKKNKTAEQ